MLLHELRNEYAFILSYAGNKDGGVSQIKNNSLNSCFGSKLKSDNIHNSSNETMKTVQSGEPQQSDLQVFLNKLNKQLDKSKLGDTIPDLNFLKEGGFGSKATPISMKDDNGLNYMLDMNGGKTYFNEEGESIRISEFEAQQVARGGVSVEYQSKNRDYRNNIIYNAEGKPVKGYLQVKNENGTFTAYVYEYDSKGNTVLNDIHFNKKVY